MYEFRSCIRLVVAVLVMFAPADAHAQSALRQLNIVPSAPEELGRVPDHLVWLRQGLQFVQDPVDCELVFVSDEGRVIGRAALPPDFQIGQIVQEIDQVRLIDASGRQQITVSRAVDPRSLRSLTASAMGRDSAGSRDARIQRMDQQRLVYEDQGRNGRRQIGVGSVTGGVLAQVYEIGVPDGSDRYFVSEEIVGSNPLDVRAFAQRFDRDGRLTGLAHIPLGSMDVVPRNFVSATGSGAVRVLVPNAGGVRIRELSFSDPQSVRSLDGDGWRTLGVTTRDIAVDSAIGTPRDAEDAKPDKQRFRLKVPTPPITRSEVIENARSFLAVNWVLKSENFSKAGIDNLCSPEEGRFWRRPVRLTRRLIGATVGPMPYRWGGDDTPESFRLRIDWGALAGDICTCRDAMFDFCLVPDSAGVDCSGFVSRAWGIEKRGTAGLLDVSTDVRRFSELRPGDAFDWPGRHIRLFVAQEPGAAIAFTVLESSTRADCEGVCQRTYRPSELNGYRMIRYRGVAD